MKTIVIGGGRGARALIELAAQRQLTELPLDIQCVVDPDAEAPGMRYAREHGIATTSDMADALALPDIEFAIELTGQDEILTCLRETLPTSVNLMGHRMARVFWDIVNAREEASQRLREITALEERIEDERLFLQNVVDSNQDLMVVLDRDLKAIKVNESFSRFAGIRSDEAAGRTCDELLKNTELANKCRETSGMLKDIIITGKPHSLVWRTQSPDETWWEVSRVPIMDPDGQVEAIVGTWHRITERVMLRREIESAEQRFRSFIDSANDWISIKDLNGRYLIVNPVCARAFGLKPEDFIGRSPEELLDPIQAANIRRHDEEAIRSGRHQVFDEVFPVEGVDCYFSTVRFPLKDYKGEVIGVCTIARDVSGERDLRSQLAQAEKLAAVGKLAAGVAHEINNPLTGVLAYAEDLLDEVGEGSPLAPDIDVIIRETLRCRDIVRNLLDFARQEKPKLVDSDLNLIMDQALALVTKLPQFQNITIEEHRSSRMPHVRCDPPQIQQVVLNLMLNAQDAMAGKGTITVSTSYDRRHNMCVLEVEDTGSGIPENLQEKLFEPFFSTKETSGLGLAVSWGIVERHHGTIEVDTAESGGAIFRVMLPAKARGQKPGA